MYGLLVNSYHSSYDYHSRQEIECEEPKASPRRTRYQTWPRKKMSSKKRKVMRVLYQIKSDRAISELNLNLISSSSKLSEIFNEDLRLHHDGLNNVNKVINDQRRNQYLSEYDKKLKEKKNGYVANGDCKIASADNGFAKGKTESEQNRSTTTDEAIFNENKLGIIRLLKNCKIRGYQNNGATSSDTRSSISSINTLNDSDSLSYCSDSTYFSLKTNRNSEYQDKVVSSSHLIQLHRPENLPPKPFSEQIKHQKEYDRMVAAVKKKERDKDLILKKKRENRLREEEKLAQATHIWTDEILPNWNHMKNSRKAYNLWWNGLPPCVRGKVWSLSVGNRLNITKDKYIECVKKSKEILKTGSRDSLQVNENYEHSVELIRLDISRTFPHLCIFQQGGPYYDILHSLLGAYVCYQPEIGYVQGMSFIAAVLLLNMDEVDAFICFANMLNRPCHKAFYSLDVQKMKTYYLAYSDLLRANMYDLYKHVNETALSPDLYLVDWVYTLFSKSMSLDLACRIWDLIFRDGEVFIFRAALGIMHLSKSELLKMDFLRSAQYLTKLPEDIDADKLFKSIECMRMCNGSLVFDDLLEQYADLIKTS